MAAKTKFLSALCSTCQDVITRLDYDDALNSSVKNVAKALNAKASSIRLLDRTGQALEIAATYGLSSRYLEKGPVEPAKSPIDKTVLAGKIIQIKDVTKDGRFQYPGQAKKEGIKSVLCVPLSCREKMLGVLRIYSDKERLFNDEEISFIRTLAFQCAAVIRHARRYDRLKSLNAIGRTITSQLQLHKVPEIICKSAAENMSAKGASIMLIHTETGRMEIIATYGLSEDFLCKGPIQADKSITACLRGHDTVIEDAAKDERIQYPKAVKKEGIKSIICIGLKMRDRIIGTLRIYTAYRYKQQQEDIEFLRTLADFGVVAIENARLYDHIKRDYDDLAKDVWNWFGWGEHQPRI